MINVNSSSLGFSIVGIIALLLLTGIGLNSTGNYVKGMEGSGNPYLLGAGIIIFIVVVVFVLRSR